MIKIKLKYKLYNIKKIIYYNNLVLQYKNINI